MRPRSRTLALAALLGSAGLGATLVRSRETASPTLSPERREAGIAFFEARWAADGRDYLAGRQLVQRYVARFGVEADLADLGRAESAATHLVAVAPDPARSWSRVSAVQLMQHKFAPALAAAEAAVRADSGDAEAWGALVDAALAAGRYAQAQGALRRLPPREVGTLTRWAAYHAARGAPRRAIPFQDRACRALARANASGLARAWCLTELAGMEGMVHGPEAERARLREALVALPGYRGALESMAGVAAAREDWREAHRLYLAVATDAHPDLYLRLGEVSRRLGLAEQAAAWESRFEAAALAPGREPLYGPEIARWLLGKGRAEEALAVARREVERRPTIESWQLLATVLCARGQHADALRALDQAAGWLHRPGQG